MIRTSAWLQQVDEWCEESQELNMGRKSKKKAPKDLGAGPSGCRRSCCPAPSASTVQSMCGGMSGLRVEEPPEILGPAIEVDGDGMTNQTRREVMTLINMLLESKFGMFNQ